MKTPEVISPYSLIQEELWLERAPDWEWRVLVACKFMNLATAKKAREVMAPFFSRYPTALAAQNALRGEMSSILRPLGLQVRRADALIKMSAQYRSGLRPPGLFGVGKYATDSWRIFVGRELINDVEDKELKNYVGWAAALEKIDG